MDIHTIMVMYIPNLVHNPLDVVMYHDYETRHRHHICIPHSHTTKVRKCIRYHMPMLLNTLPLQITAKLYTHSQIGFVNYTKQLFLNGYTSTCLVVNCYVCTCVETWCGIWGILSFFDNIGVTKLYICVHFCYYSSTCLGRPPSWAATCCVRTRINVPTHFNVKLPLISGHLPNADADSHSFIGCQHLL